MNEIIQANDTLELLSILIQCEEVSEEMQEQMTEAA